MATRQRDFWAVFARSGNPMVVVDDERVYRDVNPAACRLLRRSRDEIVGHRVGAFTPPDRMSELDSAWAGRPAGGHVVRSWGAPDVGGRAMTVGFAAAADVPEPGRHLGVVLS